MKLSRKSSSQTHLLKLNFGTKCIRIAFQNGFNCFAARQLIAGIVHAIRAIATTAVPAGREALAVELQALGVSAVAGLEI